MSDVVAVSFVVAMDRNRLIGREGELPWRLPRDLKHFRKLTWGKPIIMGRKTHESIGRPLPGRLNIVLSRGGLSAPPEVLIAGTPDEAMEFARREGAAEAMVVGGAGIYEAFLDRCRTIHLTLVTGEFEGDVRFPIDPLASSEWRPLYREPWPADADNPHDAEYVVLERNAPAGPIG